MSHHPLAGTLPDPSDLTPRSELERAYHQPDGELKPVKNGTSGHRGVTGTGFSEAHVAAMTQALVDIRAARGTFGPADSDDPAINLGGRPAGAIVIGKDVRHGSDFALRTAVEVFAGNGVPVILHTGHRATPTPVVSHTIRAGNARGENLEGAIITASHNPPEQAGYKSNGLDGGPNTRTGPIDTRANVLLGGGDTVRRLSFEAAEAAGLVIYRDLVGPYVSDLASVIDFDVLKGQRFAATSLGGAAHGYYDAINATHGTDIAVFNDEPDPSGRNRTRDWDGALRGDPSSAWVMKAVEGMRQQAGAPFIGANDNDADRFGGEDSGGSLNPNHVLCVLFDYLCRHRNLPAAMGIGRTIGTTHMLDLIAASHSRPSYEVNVGFKWYVAGLRVGKYVLAGEESAGLSLPRMDGSPWVTEKDGIAAVLLMMESITRSGLDLSGQYAALAERFGSHQYERVDMPAEPAHKAKLQALAADPAEVERRLSGQRVAGRAIERTVVGDGVKVVLEGGVWVLKRPSGTEDIVKDYREEQGESLDTARKASVELDGLLGLAG